MFARRAAITASLSRIGRHAGTHLHTVCTHIHEHDGASGVRRIPGVLALAKKNGPAATDEAAKAALELQVPTYRFLRRSLRCGSVVRILTRTSRSGFSRALAWISQLRAYATPSAGCGPGTP